MLVLLTLCVGVASAAYDTPAHIATVIDEVRVLFFVERDAVGERE